MSDNVLDPFRERGSLKFRRKYVVLGATIAFESDSRALMALVEQAFAELPRHRWSRRRAALRLELRLLPATTGVPPGGPPPLRLASGAGVLHAAFDGENFALVDPGRRRALVVATRAMLKFPYHLRYELIEFAALTLAERSQGLVALHAAAIGRNGRALLLLGDSGAGKTTLATLAAFGGWQLLGEDGVFVGPSLAASGLANYLHVRRDSLRPLPATARRALKRAPLIRRRSGAVKHAFDLRALPGAHAPSPLRLVGTVLLTAREARASRMLRALSPAKLRRELRATQPYARGQTSWRDFERRIAAMPAFELARGTRAADSLAAVAQLLRALES